MLSNETANIEANNMVLKKVKSKKADQKLLEKHFMKIKRDENGVTVFADTRETKNQRGHHYAIRLGDDKDSEIRFINFQNGAVKLNGVNGVTNEALLEIVYDRINHLNLKFACFENSVALDGIRRGLQALYKRTADRIARGVEGENKP